MNEGCLPSHAVWGWSLSFFFSSLLPISASFLLASQFPIILPLPYLFGCCWLVSTVRFVSIKSWNGLYSFGGGVPWFLLWTFLLLFLFVIFYYNFVLQLSHTHLLDVFNNTWTTWAFCSLPHHMANDITFFSSANKLWPIINMVGQSINDPFFPISSSAFMFWWYIQPSAEAERGICPPLASFCFFLLAQGHIITHTQLLNRYFFFCRFLFDLIFLILPFQLLSATWSQITGGGKTVISG